MKYKISSIGYLSIIATIDKFVNVVIGVKEIRQEKCNCLGVN